MTQGLDNALSLQETESSELPGMLPPDYYTSPDVFLVWRGPEHARGLHAHFVDSRSIVSQPVVPVIDETENWFGVYHRNDTTPALFPEKRHLAFPTPDGITGEAADGTHFLHCAPGVSSS